MRASPRSLILTLITTCLACASDAGPGATLSASEAGGGGSAGATPAGVAGRAGQVGGGAGAAGRGALATAGGAAPRAEPDAAVGGSAAPRAGAPAAGAPAVAGAGGGAAPEQGMRPPLDCGPRGIAVENAGPPVNRVNYVIVGDGYTEAQLETDFPAHLEVAMKKRFSDVIGQPYGRYRRFVNICAIKLVSESGPIGSGSTALNCTGSDSSRLADCDTDAVNEAIADNLPKSFEVDWKAVVLNNDRWWNTGSVIMLWSGAHKEAAGAALHEGGHGFHQLADEYDGTDSNCAREFGEVNVTADAMMTAGKWDLWLGYDQAGATGKQTTIEGARYCRSGQYRPSQNSMMNQLFDDRLDTAYNPVSREKMIMDIYRAVTPIDRATPPAGALERPVALEVEVIDPLVISVEWSIDGQRAPASSGARFDLAAQQLSPGSHTIEARAYDNAGDDLIRYKTGTKYGRMNWARSEQKVTWTVNVP